MSLSLEGRAILVTRAGDQAACLQDLLEVRGARVVSAPTIEVVPTDPAPLDEAILRIDTYDWVILTSVNGAEALFRRLPAGTRLPPICSIGPATSRRIVERGGTVALQPEFFQAEGVLEALAARYPTGLKGKRFLLPRARKARETLPDQLTAAGAYVDVIAVYETLVPAGARERLLKTLRESPPDLVTFTSSSTVRNFSDLVDEPGELNKVRCAVIGPVTRETATACGLAVVCMPREATIPALVESIEDYFKDRFVSSI